MLYTCLTSAEDQEVILLQNNLGPLHCTFREAEEDFMTFYYTSLNKLSDPNEGQDNFSPNGHGISLQWSTRLLAMNYTDRQTQKNVVFFFILINSQQSTTSLMIFMIYVNKVSLRAAQVLFPSPEA
jgi:hypothetical protein